MLVMMSTFKTVKVIIYNGKGKPSRLTGNCREPACFGLHCQCRTVTSSGQRDVAHCPFTIWPLIHVSADMRRNGNMCWKHHRPHTERLPVHPRGKGGWGGGDPGNSSSKLMVRNTAPPRCLLGPHLKTSTASWLIGPYVKWSSWPQDFLTGL